MLLWHNTTQIRLGVAASSWHSVCRQLADCLHHEVPHIPSPTLQAALLQRERLGSTALGGGVVLPHAVIPALEHPVVACLRTQQPIKTPTPDGLPPDLWIGLLLPEHAPHDAERQIMVIAEIMSRSETRSALRACHTPADALRWWQQWMPDDAP